MERECGGREVYFCLFSFSRQFVLPIAVPSIRLPSMVRSATLSRPYVRRLPARVPTNWNSVFPDLE
jgi:hypothetical protein